MATVFLTVKNGAAGALSADVTSGATTWTVSPGSAFPAAFPFDVTCENEIARVTNRVGDTFTVTRGVQGTSGAAHSATASVELRVTAQSISDLNTAVNVLEGGGTPGQTLIGGTGATDALTLKPSSDGTPTGDVLVDLSAGGNQSLRIKPSAVITGGRAVVQVEDAFEIGAGGQLAAYKLQSAVAINATPANPSVLLFQFFPTITLGANAAHDLRQVFPFSDQPNINLAASAIAYGITTPNYRSYRSNATFAANASGATATVTTLTGFWSQHPIGTGWTVTTRRGLHVEAATLTGVVDNEIGVDIEDLNTFPGTHTNPTISLISRGSGPELQHAGPAVFGVADAAVPTASLISGVSVALEVQSTTKCLLNARMTTTQRDAMTPIEGMQIYNSTTRQIETYDNVGGSLGWTPQVG